MNQDGVFWSSEADAWFQRNRAALEKWTPENDTPMRLLEMYGIHPKSALEIGASNGYRLAALRERYGCVAIGIEPSPSAVCDGMERFPGIMLYRGIANDLPIEHVHDLVLLNFVLHWIDRANLLRAVAEADRVLADGGYLLLGDFHPATFTRTPYHHAEGVWTYKQDYARVFTASGLYHVVACLSGGHAGGLDGTAGEHERVATWLLRKDLHGHYVDKPR